MTKFLKTIKSWYTPDENGRINKVAITLFTGALFLPIVLLEGIKLGLYDMYTVNSIGIQVIIEGLSLSFLSVLQLRNKGTFGTSNMSSGFVWDYLVIFLLIYGAIIAISFIIADRNKNKSTKKDGWTEFANIDKFNKDFAYPKGAPEPSEPEEGSYEPGNMILGEKTRYDLEPKGTNTYSCALIVGATGSGKSFTYVKPNILQMNSSYVITDPKGELTRDTGKALLDHGYNVRLFNVSEPQFSCKYNPFKYIRDEAGVIKMVEVFLDNTNDPNASSGNDPFFALAEKNFYLAIFFYIYTVYKDQPEKQTFKTVYEMYQAADEPEVNPRAKEQPEPNDFDKKFTELGKKDPMNPALGYYNTFKKGTAKTKQSILISAGVRLWFMSVGEIANLLSDDELHLETMGDRKSALFVIIPTENKTFNFLSAMLFTQLFETLYHIGNTVNEKSWLLVEGNCAALRSKPFIMGTPSEQETKAELEIRRQRYADAILEDDAEEMEKSEKKKKYFTTPNEYGIIPWPKVRLKDATTGDILEEFNSRKEAEIIQHAARYGQIKQGSKTLTCHVRFMMDEFFNIGKIPDFDLKLATFRSLRISADIILQSIAQIKEMYEDRHGKITSNCSVTILLGANDLDDCKWFSDLIGQTTVRSESINIDNKGLFQGSSGGSISDNAQMLLRPEQIRTMHKDECLILVNTAMPIRDKKYNATKHPRWKESLDSHDSNTAKNEFQYRRLFFIEQKDENRVVNNIKDAPISIPTAIPKSIPKVITSLDDNPNSYAKNYNQVKCSYNKETNDISVHVPPRYTKDSTQASNAYKHLQENKAKGYSPLQDKITSLNKTVEEQYQKDMTIDGFIPVAKTGKDIRKRFIEGAKSGEVKVDENNVAQVSITPSVADLYDSL